MGNKRKKKIMKKTYNKLVRDNIPEIIVNNGGNIQNKDEFINSILANLTNEYPEFSEYFKNNE